MTLEELIREAAGKRLDGLTLWIAPDGRCQANARYTGAKGWVVEHDPDPVAALKSALGEKAETPADPDNIFD